MSSPWIERATAGLVSDELLPESQEDRVLSPHGSGVQANGESLLARSSTIYGKNMRRTFGAAIRAVNI